MKTIMREIFKSNGKTVKREAVLYDGEDAVKASFAAFKAQQSFHIVKREDGNIILEDKQF